MNNINFPDKEYLDGLLKHLKAKVNRWQSPADLLLMLSSASMNWIGDYLTDQSIKWEKQSLDVDKLWLTGTNPEWNKIIIDQAKRSPQLLKRLMDSDPGVKGLFADIQCDGLPILVRFEEDQYKVLDGMHRVLAAIRDGKMTLEAYVAKGEGKPMPYCEPHVVYDLLKAYHRKLNPDRQGLITALKFLRKSYANVDELLKERFTKVWVPDDEIQDIIKEALKE